MKCLSEKLISGNKIYFEDSILKPFQAKKVQVKEENIQEMESLSPLSPIEQVIFPELSLSPIDQDSIIKRDNFDEEFDISRRVITDYKDGNEFIDEK